jgi:hypothetical protein
MTEAIERPPMGDSALRLAGQAPHGYQPPHPHQAGPHGHAYPQLVVDSDPFSRWLVRVWSRSPVWMAPVAILVCFAGGVAYTLLDRPTEATAFSSPTCLVKLTTGFDCPGCGGTRAFWYLMHGNLPAAARAHIMAVFAAPFLVYMYLAWTANVVFKWNVPMLRLSTRTISFFLAAWGVFAVLRNLPWAPFTWLYV